MHLEPNAQTAHGEPPVGESGEGPRPHTAQSGGVREVWVLAYPVVLTQISITAMQFVDSAMVGSLGATELAAVGIGGIWLWTILCFFMGATNAVQTFVAQRFGAGDERACGAWTWHGIYALLPLTAAVAGALVFGADQFMRWIGPSEEVQPLAASYVAARSLGAVALIGSTSIAGFFRGIGDTRTPLYTTVLANIVNAVLDYGLIFGELGLPELGVEGAGIATAIAEWTFLIAMAAFFFRQGVARRYATRPVAFSARDTRRLIRIGAPIGGQWFLEMTSFAAFSTLVAQLGDAPMAASQAFVVLLSLSFMQASGVSTAVATLVGQYIGARDLAAVERSFRSGVVLCSALAVSIATLFATFPEALIGIFSDDREVLRLARPLLMVGAAFQIFDAFAIVADGALRGAGDTRWPFLARFVLSWGVFVPLAYTFGVILDGGLTAAWSGGAVYVFGLALLLVHRFRSGAWQSLRL